MTYQAPQNRSLRFGLGISKGLNFCHPRWGQANHHSLFTFLRGRLWHIHIISFTTVDGQAEAVR